MQHNARCTCQVLSVRVRVQVPCTIHLCRQRTGRIVVEHGDRRPAVVADDIDGQSVEVRWT